MPSWEITSLQEQLHKLSSYQKKQQETNHMNNQATYICTSCKKQTKAAGTMTMLELVELCAVCYEALEVDNQAVDAA